MTDKLHPADAADIEKIATATHFTVHLRAGPHDKVTKRAKTLAAAIRAADAMGKTGSGKRPMIYAITPDGASVHVPAAVIAQARQEAERKAAAGRKRGRAAVEALGRAVEGMMTDDPKVFRKAATAPRRAASKAKGERPIGRRAEIAENAAKGILPPVPDFSAETHRRFRGKLAEIVALVEVGDVAGLKAMTINPVSSSPKAMAKYRDLAVIAIEARQKEAA